MCLVLTFILEYAAFISHGNHSPQEVYNYDGIKLNFKQSPKENFAAKTDLNASSGTVLECNNAAGNNELPLKVIGMAKNSNPFKQMRINSFSVFYTHQKRCEWPMIYSKTGFISVRPCSNKNQRKCLTAKVFICYGRTCQ